MFKGNAQPKQTFITSVTLCSNNLSKAARTCSCSVGARQHLNKAVSIGPSKDTPVGWGPEHYHIQAILMYTYAALKGKVCKQSRLGEGIKIRG